MEYKCFSHPKKYLIDHLNNVKKIGLSVFDSKILLNLPIDVDDFKDAQEIALWYHDFGKSTKFFQEYLHCSIDNQKCSYERELRNHSLLSAIFAGYIAYKKFESKDIRLACLVFISILKHHGDMDNLNDMLVVDTKKWRILEKQWDCIIWHDFNLLQPEFSVVKNCIDNELYDAYDSIEWDITWYFASNLMFSILTYADKNDVIFEKPFECATNIDTSVVYSYKKANFIIDSEINIIREEACSLVENILLSNLNQSIFSLNLPTGFGKTLTAINTALQILNNDSSIKRIIYALPFTSIVEQTAGVVKKLYGYESENILNVHHHLAEIKVKLSEDYLDADKAQFIIENWDKPFIVTTFWQIFYSMLSNGNSILRKFHNVSNSVVILDEIQTLPYRYWKLTNFLLTNLVETLNCKIIIMTATMPMIFDKDKICNLIDKSNRKKYFSIFNRYSINKINLEGLYLDELLPIVKTHIIDSPDKDIMFIFNTIKSARVFFFKLKEVFFNHNIFFLSSRVLPIDRFKVINQIKFCSGRKILITTQLVEAGVDIDFDIVYRDFAPLDNIIQAAGRCNRHCRKPKGSVYVFRLKDYTNKYDCEYIYHGLLLDTTLSIFEKVEKLDECSLNDIIDNYYHKLKNNSSTNESRELINSIEKLEYKGIKEKFKLIDDLPSFSLFVEKDINASKILDNFKEIREIEDPFERKKKFLQIKSQFYQYVISLPMLSNDAKYSYQSFDEMGSFKILRKDFVQMLYKDDVGFIVDINEKFL